MSDETDALKSAIAAAFSDVPPPQEGRIARPSADDREDIESTFRGRHWRDMPVDALLRHHLLAQSLSSMTLEAFRFFFPGFLLLAVDHPASDVADAVLCHLTPPRGDQAARLRDVHGASREEQELVRRAVAASDSNISRHMAEYEERLRLFTRPQRDAILSFLHFLHQGTPSPDSDAFCAIQRLAEMNRGG